MSDAHRLLTTVTVAVALVAGLIVDPARAEPPEPVEPIETGTGGTNETETGETDELPAGSAFVGVVPCRLFDSRTGERLAAGTTIDVVVGGRCGAPDGARAAAVTITVVEPAAAGFVTAWGDGERPDSSNVNFAGGQTVANSSIVPIGADGGVRILVDARAHVLVDVAGAFVDATASRAGRYVPVVPSRITDSREHGLAPLPGSTRIVPLPVGIPADATALAATVTVVEARRAGYVTAHPAGSPPPDASISNLGAGQTRAASTILPVSADGLEVHLDAGGHLLIDVTGWFTGASADESADGLFVPVPPVRLHDSRSPRRTIAAGGTREIGLPDAGSAWAVNITATDVRRDGFVTASAARTGRPETSVINASTGTATSNSAIVPMGTHGLAVYSNTTLDVVVDGSGWFTGQPQAATTGPAPDLVAPARVLVVGDSAAAGMRWHAGVTTALRGAEFTLDLESCRRLVRPSCRGREGRFPDSALPAVERHPYGRFDTLVVATGYNDVDTDLDAALDAIVTTARARGMRTIVWLTYREDVGYEIPSGTTSYPLMNDRLGDLAGHHGVVVFDWWGYTADAPHWFADDSVHQTPAGSLGLADALSRVLAALDGRACPMPWTVGASPERPCPAPDPLPDERDGVPDVEALYPGAAPPDHE